MRPTKTLLVLLIGVVLLAASLLPAHAVQGDYFSVSGTVTDANWNPVPGAVVSLYDNDFNIITTQRTTAQGYFSFQGVSVKTNLCNLGVLYTDSDGVDHQLPSYYIPAFTAKDDVQLDPKQTHYDDYTMPGSIPHTTPVPTPTPTPDPTVVPTADPAPSDNTMVYILLFIGGFTTGASVALLGCIVVLRPRKPAN